MADITKANALDTIKNFGYSLALTATHRGAVGSSGTLLYAIDQARQRSQAFDDDQGHGGAMESASFLALSDLGTLEAMTRRREIHRFLSLWGDSQQSPGGYSSLDAFWLALRSEGDRIPAIVAKAMRALHASLSPLGVFPPVDTSFGLFAVTGAAAGTDTPVASPYDTALYGGATLEANITTQVDTADTNDLVVKVYGQQLNGDAWVGTLTIPHNQGVGTQVAVVADAANTFPVKLDAPGATTATQVITSDNGSLGAWTLRSKLDYAYAA